MSFSSRVKEELARQESSARHCQIAEAAAIFRMCGKAEAGEDGQYRMTVRIENQAAARKFSLLLKKSFHVRPEISVRGEVHIFTVRDQEELFRILKAMKLTDGQGFPEDRRDFVDGMIVQNACCRRSFMRGAFLVGGSISNPEKSYHLEIVCSGEEKAFQLQSLAASLHIEAKIVQRKKYYVFYIKEGSQIVDMLGLMGAHVSLMELENVRILKEMRGSVNRKVNCETANINKTVSAAVEQINDILYIRDRIGFDKLPEGLEEIALARLEQPEATLKELGDSLSPPVGKSGVNHRLRKIKELAGVLRENEEESL